MKYYVFVHIDGFSLNAFLKLQKSVIDNKSIKRQTDIIERFVLIKHQPHRHTTKQDVPVPLFRSRCRIGP